MGTAARPGPLGSAVAVAGGLDVNVPGDGVRLRATRWPGEGPAVLLLHGLANQRRFWNLVVPPLVSRGNAGGSAVVALDQRGHGDSDQPPDGYDSATIVRDAVVALDALALSRVVVVGHSWGAWTALELAATCPERVLAVVAVDGGFLSMHRVDRPREELRRSLEPPRVSLPVDELRSSMRSGPLGPYWSQPVEDAILPIFAVGDDGLARPRLPFELHMRIVDTLLDRDSEAVLSDVRCPAWVVSCESAPRNGRSSDAAAEGGDEWGRHKTGALERAGRLLPDPRILRWGGAIHDVPLQWPALVSGLVRTAVDEVAVAAGRPRGARAQEAGGGAA